MAIPSFVDRATLHVAGGNGGHGCASVHREKFKPLGGPDGGNGGNGGSVILRVDDSLTTLVDYHRQSRRRATNGQPGMGDYRNGANGDDIVLAVPDGTIVSDADTGDILADLVGPGAEVTVAGGGRGGLGNAALASSARKAPGFALLGEEGEARTIALELKVLADIGLVGFRHAGKSSLIAAISRARPKIDDYPFTTLIPNLGVVVAGETTFTVADVPGLIEGASEGRGLGFDFLRHIERCLAIAHVIDCATYEPGRDPLTDLDIIEGELAAHGGLEDRPRLVVLNKIDIPDARGGRHRPARARVSRAARLRDLDEVGRGPAGADLRHGRPGGAPSRRSPAGRTRAHRDPSGAGGGRAGVHHQADGRRRGRLRLARPRREARALGLADRLQQPRGRRVPGRPLLPAGHRDELLPRRACRRCRGHRGRRQPVVFDFAADPIGAEILARRGGSAPGRERPARPAAAAGRRYHARKAETEAERAVRIASYGLDPETIDKGWDD